MLLGGMVGAHRRAIVCRMIATASSPAEAVLLVREQGYCVVPGALSPAELAALQPRFIDLLTPVVEAQPGARHVELRRLIEADTLFADLAAHPSTLPIARELIGRDVTLASAGEGDWRPPHTPAYISWHNDFTWMADVPYPRQNRWIRCIFFLSDVTEDNGPFTVFPGSHRADRACPSAALTDEHGQPRDLPGMVRITGKAGDCLINDTEIWHTNTANRSDHPRQLAMFLYKHAWMRMWEAGYEITPEFAAAQTDPRRRQLCGVGPWHRTNGVWDIPGISLLNS